VSVSVDISPVTNAAFRILHCLIYRFLATSPLARSGNGIGIVISTPQENDYD